MYVKWTLEHVKASRNPQLAPWLEYVVARVEGGEDDAVAWRARQEAERQATTTTTITTRRTTRVVVAEAGARAALGASGRYWLGGEHEA